jgi:hypothetical protein
MLQNLCTITKRSYIAILLVLECIDDKFCSCHLISILKNIRLSVCIERHTGRKGTQQAPCRHVYLHTHISGGLDFEHAKHVPCWVPPATPVPITVIKCLFKDAKRDSNIYSSPVHYQLSRGSNYISRYVTNEMIRWIDLEMSLLIIWTWRLRFPPEDYYLENCHNFMVQITVIL